MSKFKQLSKRLGIELGIVLAMLAAVVGLMLLTSGMLTSAEEARTQAENTLSQDRSQLANLRSQLERSGEAERRFVDIQLERTNLDFGSDTDALKAWAADAKRRYRLANNFRLNLPPEQPSDKPELSGLDYDITVRKAITMELEAMSDLHVFSMMEDLRRSMPGLVRVTYIEMERQGDLTPQTIAQMVGGMAPSLIAAKIQYDWIGINPKSSDSAAPGAAAPAPAMGMPGGAM